MVLLLIDLRGESEQEGGRPGAMGGMGGKEETEGVEEG